MAYDKIRSIRVDDELWAQAQAHCKARKTTVSNEVKNFLKALVAPPVAEPPKRGAKRAAKKKTPGRPTPPPRAVVAERQEKCPHPAGVHKQLPYGTFCGDCGKKLS